MTHRIHEAGEPAFDRDWAVIETMLPPPCPLIKRAHAFGAWIRPQHPVPEMTREGDTGRTWTVRMRVCLECMSDERHFVMVDPG